MNKTKIYTSFIKGEAKKGEVLKEILNPSTGEVLARVWQASSADLKEAIEAARLAFDRGPWPQFSLAHRKAILLRFSELILAQAKELAQLESANTGKPIKETTFMDIPSAAESFKYFGSNLERFLGEEEIEVKEPAAQVKANLIRQPRGVTLLIVPWNYPLLIAAWKTAQSLAAGNTVVLKPASQTPLTALELARLGREAGLPPGVLNVVVASGDLTGSVLSGHKDIDLISFTGSNQVGKKIVKDSAENIKKTIMELGGKSANIICQDADLETALKGVLASVFLNQGQMCTAASRLLIHKNIYAEFKKRLKEYTQKIKLGNALDFQTQMGPLVSQAQRDKVFSFIEKARQENLDIICGGKIPKEQGLDKGFFFEPALIGKVGPKSALFQEEIFGPVATLTQFSSCQEAISLANSTQFGLAACLWTKDKEKAKKMAKDITAGLIWVNTYGMFLNQLPFGGFKKSGFGKELGRAGFFEYTCLKNVVFDQSPDSKPLVSYWYGF